MAPTPLARPRGLFPAAAAALSALWCASTAPPAFAQTDVGCDATCPPRGYEYDSSHLCPGSTLDAFAASRSHDVCHPSGASSLSFEDLRGRGKVTVVANYYTGCEAGRRESGVYAGVAQRIHDATEGRVTFVTSLKGGGDCAQWASIYQGDALTMGLNGGVRPSTMPLTVEDGSLDVRDRMFTPPYPHPSYIVLDENLEVTFKGVGPCCGYRSYYQCTDDIALGLDKMLTDRIYEVYDRQMAALEATSNSVEAPPPAAPVPVATPPPIDDGSCLSTVFSEWSACSKTCGDGGIQFRFSSNRDLPVETRPCPVEQASFLLPPCSEQCVPEFGSDFDVTVVASGLASPRDLAFHPTPGVHLGMTSEGRNFYPYEGEELWVANGLNHSVSIVASLGTEHQTTLSRRDRGYYHYMNNISALSFNTVGDSGRGADQDTYNFFAVCNDNRNDYLGSKEPNYFMGPTLYDSDTVNRPGRKNTVTRLGNDCSQDPSNQCFFLHADMLHESPACIGIVHDPEVESAYGAVYWAWDKTGDNSGNGGQLVRFDFSQPHGPGSMDHSIASVRRYPEVKLFHDSEHEYGGHAGMALHPKTRVLYISNPGKGTVLAVHADSGKYQRTAREEYPIFSNRLPSFEYSIYGCVDFEETFVDGLSNPTGLALSLDGTRLFVAEREGRIVSVDVGSGALLQTIDLRPTYTSIGGLAVSPKTGALYFVDMDSNEAVRIDAARFVDGQCTYQSHVNPDFQSALAAAQSQVDAECGQGTFSLIRDYLCEIDGSIPNGTLFEQVHTNTGYASDDPDVQAMAGMDAAAALLANRTDCDYDSDLNFDALLLGGYYCHMCLPNNHGSSCDPGGTCANVQWQGFTCDNEFFVDYDEDEKCVSLVASSPYHDRKYLKDGIQLSRGVTYRFTVRTGLGRPVSIGTLPAQSTEMSVESSVKSIFNDQGGVTEGPIMLKVDAETPDCLYLRSPESSHIPLIVDGASQCVSGTSSGTDCDADSDLGSNQGDGDIDGWDILPQAPSSARVFSPFLGVGHAFVVISLAKRMFWWN